MKANKRKKYEKLVILNIANPVYK